MCDSHRPENGADSEPVEEQPMVELPRPTHELVMRYMRDAMPGASEQELLTEASKVVMADALGRAIHAAKRFGGPWPAPCVRSVPSAPDQYEPVPYGYGDQQECECEAMALHLVQLMETGAAVDLVKSGTGRIVLPKGMN